MSSRSQRWVDAPRLIFVNRYFYPDVSATSQILFDLARRMVEQGIEVHVLCSRQLYENSKAHLPHYECVHGIAVHRVWTSRFGRDRLLGRAFDYASFYASAGAKLLALLRRGDVVVAKTDPPLISVIAGAAARLKGAALVNWLQDVFPEVASHLGANPLPGWVDAILRAMRDRSLMGARMNVVLGSRMREHVESRGIRADRLRIIENWADGAAVQPKEAADSTLRAQLGLRDKFVVAYSGNLGRAHEFETLLAAAEQLRDDDGVVFLMIGGGVKMQMLREAVEQRGLANFRFLPYQPREALADALAAADVHLACLLPQLEGLIVPSKFYGILAAGRPVVFIGDSDGELARIINEAGCGAAVRLGDAAGLKQVIERLRSEPAQRIREGAAARELFIAKYTVERAVGQWLSVMHECGIERSAVECRTATSP